MKRLAAILCLTLTACAGPQLSAPGDPVGAQCEYEAEAATANMPNPIYAGVMMAQLYQKCMRAKGR